MPQPIAKGIDIMGIQEHHIGNDEEVRYTTIKGQFLINSLTWRSKEQAACGGVGVVMSHREKSLRKVKAYSKQIMIIECVGNPVITIIVVYSFDKCGSGGKIKQFNNSLRTAIGSIPTHNLLVVLSDFNAHPGVDDATFTFHDPTNRKGEYLFDLMQENSLKALHTYFQKRKGNYEPG